MKSLLRTILDEAEKNKLMYRADAYQLWNEGCEDMIVPWGYDQDKLIETFNDIELDPRGGNIGFMPEAEVKTHKQLIKSLRKEAIANCYDEHLEHFKTCTDDEIIQEFPREYYCGNYVIMWEVYNEDEECLSDYHTGLDKYFDLSKLAQTWGEKLYKLRKSLS
jgi:hypothetical protein